MRRKIFWIVLLGIFIIYILFLFLLPIRIKTYEGTFSINKFSRKLIVKTSIASSAVNPIDPTHPIIISEDNTVYLTPNEYWKVWNIYYFNPYNKIRKYLPDVLEAISKDTKEFGDSKYLECDLNNDGYVTYREFGDHWLFDDM